VSKNKDKGGDDLKDDKDAVATQKSAQTEDTRDKVVVEDEPVDLDREIQEEIKNTDPDRWKYQTERTKELMRSESTLCDSSPDSGEEEEVNKEERTSDDACFKQTMTEMGKKRNKSIKIKLPAVKLTDPRVPKEVKKMKHHLHRLFGHFNWAAIKQTSEHIEGAELVKLFKLADSLPDEYCSGCVEGKSRMMPRPKGHTERPIPRGRPQKLYVDLSGRIEEGSVFHSYHYYLAGLTEFGFAVLTGIAFKSQALLGCVKIFNILGDVPITLQIDVEGNLNTPIAINYLEGTRECEVITTSSGAHFRHGKVERFHATIKGSGRTMMFDSGVSVQFWYYSVVHAVLIYNMMTMTRSKNDQDQDKTVWEVQYGQKPDEQRLLLSPFGCLTYLILNSDQRKARHLSGHFGVRVLSGIYLGCVFNTKSGVYDFLMTDDRSVFSTPNQMRSFGDIFPCKLKLTRTSLIPHRSEDLQDEDSDDEEESFLVHYARSWESACKTKITEEQNERTYVSRESVKGSGMKTKLKGDDRMYGRNMKKPIKVSSEKDGGETVSTDVFKEVPDTDTNTHFEDPRDYGAVSTLEADHLFEEPYPDARYSIVVPIDHSDDKLVRRWNRRNDVPVRRRGIIQLLFIFIDKIYVRRGPVPTLYPLILHALDVRSKKKIYQ
jgi:hypothetical protein